MNWQQEGANVIICGRNKENLEKTKQEIEKQTNKELLAIAGDLSIAAERDHIIKTALESYSAIDILVTNAGGPPSGKFEELKQQDWDNAYKSLLGKCCGFDQWLFARDETKAMGPDHFNYIDGGETTCQ